MGEEEGAAFIFFVFDDHGALYGGEAPPPFDVFFCYAFILESGEALWEGVLGGEGFPLGFLHEGVSEGGGFFFGEVFILLVEGGVFCYEALLQVG